MKMNSIKFKGFHYFIGIFIILCTTIFSFEDHFKNQDDSIDDYSLFMQIADEDGLISHRKYPFSTITASGLYRLANSTTSAITISASDVTLDLDGFKVAGGIIVNGGLDQITIRNGVVEGSTDAIVVNGGTTNVTIDGVMVKNAIRGINFENVTGGTISNCEMTLNTTGLELDNSHKIVVKDCVANCNTHAGYCLLSSTTCCVLDSKALSTGEGNTEQFDNNVFGFVSANGFGNIFERCIANSTQAITTSDSNSLIAGFALRGSEKCSKIVDSEAANAVSDVEGFAVPYGILLEASLGSEITWTASPPVPIPGDTVLSVNWSPDGQYLAAGISDTSDSERIRIYRFDRVSNTLTQVATPNIIPGDSVFSVNWSPDGQYVAAGIDDTGDSERIRIYRFDRSSNTLTQVATPNVIPGDSVISVNWSPDGQYVAAGMLATGDSERIRIYRFDRSSNTLTQVATPNIIPGDGVISVNWSLDGQYLAAGILDTGDSERIRIYRFDRSSNTLTQVATPNVIPGDGVFSVNWSPDGQYLAAG